MMDSLEEEPKSDWGKKRRFPVLLRSGWVVCPHCLRKSTPGFFVILLIVAVFKIHNSGHVKTRREECLGIIMSVPSIIYAAKSSHANQAWQRSACDQLMGISINRTCVSSDGLHVCTQVKGVKLNEKSQPSPRSDCLDGLASWGLCQRGEFLCKIRGASRRALEFPLSEACVLDGIEYVCTSLRPGQLPLDSCSSVCLDQETSDGICTTGKLCQKQSVCPRQIGHKCIPSADQIVNHRCIDGACLLQNVIFDVNWTGPTNGDRLSFGCSVEWCEVQEKFVCSLELRSEKTAGTAKLPIPPMLPHECSMLSHLRNGREALPIAIPAVFTAPNACERTVSTMAVLIFVDGWNPFHQVLQTFRVLFESLATFSMDWIAPTGQQLSDCIIALSPRNTVGEIGPFGRNVLSSFCNQGILELQRSQTLCFSRLLIGTTPGGWDMSLNPEDPARVNFAGIYMGQWIKRHFGIAIVDELNVGKSSITLILRRGRRSILNEEDVVRTLACKTGDICLYSLETIDLDKATFRSTVGLFAKTAVLLGVHGAGLTNLIFMPRGGAVVELRLARSRPDYVQLCRSFGKLHFEFTKTRMVMPPSPITWPVLDDRDLLVEVSEPWELVAVVHNISSLVYHRAGACC